MSQNLELPGGLLGFRVMKRGGRFRIILLTARRFTRARFAELTTAALGEFLWRGSGGQLELPLSETAARLGCAPRTVADKLVLIIPVECEEGNGHEPE